MNYEECAKELLEYMIENQRTRCRIQKNISELAKGEIAVLIYLMQHDGAHAHEISQFFDINTSRVAAILNSLTKKQFVERHIDKEDKRKIKVYITIAGKQFASERHDHLLSKMAMVLEALGEEDTLNYIRIMKRVVDLMGSY